MSCLFVAWQAPLDRKWFPVGRLTYNGTRFRFVYTKGAGIAHRDCGFQPFGSFSALDGFYESAELFPLFANRVPPTDREDYGDFAQWLNVPRDSADPVAMLARSGGRRQTDTLELLPCPERDPEGAYHIHFFAHGLRYLSSESHARISRLKAGDDLLAALDFQNPHDTRALILRTNDAFPGDRFIVGYCPSYLLGDTFELLTQCPSLSFEVERLNPPPAPLQFRLLCNMTTCWPKDFRPFSSEEYQPMANGTKLEAIP